MNGSSKKSDIESILKSRGKSEAPLRVVNPALEDDSLDEDDFLDGDDSDLGLDDDMEDDEDDDAHEGDFGNSDDDSASEAHGKSDSAESGKASRTQRDQLAQDDAAIEDFERKLGIKKGRKNLPQSFKDDGLDLLMADLDEDEDEYGDGESDLEAKKRMHEFDDWLSAKRRKTGAAEKKSAKVVNQDSEEDEDGSLIGSDEDDDDNLDDLDLEGGSDDEDGKGFDDDSFGGFDSDGEHQAPSAPRQRENPYVAPTTGQVVAKYVPPSLRAASSSEGEARTRLRKQIQGQVNRLSDANILSIVQSIEQLYQNNARGDVTEALTDTMIAQVWKPESLPDQFFVLTGGFCAATYKLIGASFGSHLVRRLVKDFGDEYDKAKTVQGDESAIPKEPSNLLALLSQLYVFDVVSCRIIFDFMERLLDDLTEINVELLLRICRMAGRLLRRDDPQALKHVSSVLGKAVAKRGYGNVSVRTKFMIETIDDLKNSKSKAKGVDSAVVSEHVLRMKKRLGELKSQSRRLDGLAPMGISLDDVENADVRGKWWLVGASVPAKTGGEGGAESKRQDSETADYTMVSDNEDMDFVLPDYPKKARSQGLATPTQIAIFTALLSATDAESGYRQFIDLRLKRDEQNEIARVLVQCVGSEAAYNPYYAMVAQQACNNRKISFAFQNRLWQIFRGLGEQLFGEDEDYEETADSERMKDENRLSNVAQFYASLFLDGSLSITILKPLELPKISKWTSILMERLVVSVLKGCRSNDTEKEDMRLRKVFGATRQLPVLSAGLHWFLRKRLRRSKTVSSKELRKLDAVIGKAQALVEDGGD
jgi:nucleolar MIF4G domain-containing protein 1